MPVMTPPQRRWAGKLFLFPGAVLYLGPGASAGLHRHHAVQFVWAQAQPLSVALRGRSRPRTAVLIPANEPHALVTKAERVALLLVERHGARGGTLHRLALQQAGRDASALLASIAFPAAGLNATAAAAWCDDLLSALGAGSPAPELSPAIERGIAYVEAAQDYPARLDDAARCAQLSPTRFTHRFSAEVGIPFRRYVLWARIKRAVEAVQGGATLTDAAAAAGFSDSAHLSRTFRAMFGLSPSLLLPHMEIVGSLWGPAAGTWSVQ